MIRLRDHAWVLGAGLLMGLLGSLLAYWGNPPNTGICISCFLENSVGALGLHPNPRMQYMRPELLGFFLGSAAAAWAGGELRARARSPGIHLLGLGFLMVVGSAVFIGCPIKAVLRAAAGDLTALPGLLGLAGGVVGGLGLLGTGDLGLGGRACPAPRAVLWGLLAAGAVLTALLFVPGALRASRVGGGSLHAPLLVSLGAGLVLGGVCQRSRFCIAGSLRDLIWLRSAPAGLALVATLGAAALANAFTGQFRLGYYDQPGSHLEVLWSFLGMGLVGMAAVVAGGCPFRQIIRAGEGDLDAATVVAGMGLGAALVQIWSLGGTAAGVPAGGKVAVLLGLAALLSLGLFQQEAGT